MYNFFLVWVFFVCIFKKSKFTALIEVHLHTFTKVKITSVFKNSKLLLSAFFLAFLYKKAKEQLRTTTKTEP